MQARTDARIFREKGLLGDPHDEVAGGAGALHMDERNAARFVNRYDSRSHHVNVMRDFLNDPAGQLERLLDDER